MAYSHLLHFGFLDYIIAFWFTIRSTIKTMISAPETNMPEDQWLEPLNTVLET